MLDRRTLKKGIVKNLSIFTGNPELMDKNYLDYLLLNPSKILENKKAVLKELITTLKSKSNRKILVFYSFLGKETDYFKRLLEKEPNLLEERIVFLSIENVLGEKETFDFMLKLYKESDYILVYNFTYELKQMAGLFDLIMKLQYEVQTQKTVFQLYLKGSVEENLILHYFFRVLLDKEKFNLRKEEHDFILKNNVEELISQKEFVQNAKKVVSEYTSSVVPNQLIIFKYAPVFVKGLEKSRLNRVSPKQWEELYPLLSQAVESSQVIMNKPQNSPEKNQIINDMELDMRRNDSQPNHIENGEEDVNIIAIIDKILALEAKEKAEKERMNSRKADPIEDSKNMSNRDSLRNGLHQSLSSQDIIMTTCDKLESSI